MTKIFNKLLLAGVSTCLLSSLAFTGTLSDNGSKVIEEVGNAPAKTEKAATPANSTTTTATKPAATPATPEKK